MALISSEKSNDSGFQHGGIEPASKQQNEVIAQIRKHLQEGRISETQAKNQLLENLVDQEIPTIAVNKYLEKDTRNELLTRQDREDVISRVHERLAEKLKIPASEGGLNFFQKTPDSGGIQEYTDLQSWAYRFSKAVARSAVREELSLRTRTVIPTGEHANIATNYTKKVFDPPSTDHYDVDVHAVVSALKQISFHNLRGVRQTHTLGRVLSIVLGVQLPQRIHDHELSAKLYGLLDDDPPVAGRSALDTVYEENPVLPIWAGHDYQTLTRIASWPTLYSYALAFTAIAPYPRPSEREFRKYLAALRGLSGNKGWKELSKDLGEAVAATCCERVSPYTQTALKTESYRRGLVAMEEKAGQLHQLLEQASRFPGHPLGQTTEDVSSRTQQILADFVPLVSTSELAERIHLADG